MGRTSRYCRAFAGQVLNSFWNTASPPTPMTLLAPASAASAWADVDRLGLWLSSASASQTK